jgi:hypothetical protein
MGELERGSVEPEAKRKHSRKTYNDNLGIPITIMQFGKLHRHDITVQGIDISEGGVGIISEMRIAPGFVWFWRRVGSQKAGIVMWSRRTNGTYRAGIQFLPLPREAEEQLATSD